MTSRLFALVVLLCAACRPLAPPAGPAPSVPSATYLLDEAALPDYERTLDHAGLMADWNEEFFHKGRVTYRNACYSCHGDTGQPGSIPNSRQFWQEAFKNGADPLALYQTLTRGFGTMPPQVRLTPREKGSSSGGRPRPARPHHRLFHIGSHLRLQADVLMTGPPLLRAGRGDQRSAPKGGLIGRLRLPPSQA